MNGLCDMSYSTLLQSCCDDGRVFIKSSMKWKVIKKPGLRDPKLGGIMARPRSRFYIRKVSPVGHSAEKDLALSFRLPSYSYKK